MLLSFKRKQSAKEGYRVLQPGEIVPDLFNREVFVLSTEEDLSKASAKAVKKRAAVI
jgi:hypothetical protein